MVSKAMQAELAKKARAANRRLERASESQRKALDYFLKNYETRQGTHGTVFKQGKAANENEYRKRIRELDIFLAGEISKISGWKALKAKNLTSATKTISGMGYNLTEDELAMIIKETGGKKAMGKSGSGALAWYKALNNVQAYKSKLEKDKSDSFTGLTESDIQNAIAIRNTSYQATLSALKP